MNKKSRLFVFIFTISFLVILRQLLYMDHDTSEQSFKHQRSAFNICHLDSSSYRPVLRDNPQLRDYVKNHPNLPSLLLEPSTISSRIPDVYQIRWTGVLWQESWAKDPKFFLYSAHFDEREKFWKQDYRTYIRILSLYNGDARPKSGYCQLHFGKTGPMIIVPVQEFKLVDWQHFAPTRLLPYMISCLVPHQKHSLPVAVSLVLEQCDTPTNILNVSGLPLPSHLSVNNHHVITSSSRQSDEHSLAVCGTAVRSFDVDSSHRLVEWIELLFLLGVSKIFLHRMTNHPNVDKVLDYYEQNGKIQTVLFRFPPPYVDQEAFRQAWIIRKRPEIFAMENVYFTDCVLRLKDEFRYVGHFDPDEVPVLKNFLNIKDLLLAIATRGNYASYKLLWRTFYPDMPPGKLTSSIPERFHILRHNKVYEVPNPVLENNGKSIYDTKQVLGLHSHSPLSYVDGSSGNEYFFKKEEAYTAHYRSQKCGEACLSVNNWEEDIFMPYKDQLVNNVNNVLTNLGIPYED